MAATAADDELTPWETELLAHLTDHVRREAELLDSYRSLADETGSAFVSYLVTLLAEDEARHHRLFGDMVDTLRAKRDTNLAPAVPLLMNVVHAPELLAATERFLEAERDDAAELKRLARALRHVPGADLWSLLVELMARDTRKHQRILRFLRSRLREQVRD